MFHTGNGFFPACSLCPSLRKKYVKTQPQTVVTLFLIDDQCVFLPDMLAECK